MPRSSTKKLSRISSSHSFYFWTWLAILLAAAISVTIFWLHYKQWETITQAERILGDIREARTDLAKGFLNVLNAADETSPFRREQGMALMNQAIASLQQAPYWNAPRSGRSGQSAMTRAEFDAKTKQFLTSLSEWNSATPPGRSGLDVELRVAYHQLERQAELIDLASKGEFHTLIASLDHKFTLTVVVSTFLLAAFCAGVFIAGRNEQKAGRALQEREAQLFMVGDNLPDSYIYQYTHGREGQPQFLHLSAGVERVHGLTIGEVLEDANCLHSQIEASQIPLWAAAEAKSASELSDFEMELKIRRGDGGERLLLVRSRPVRMENGAIRWDGIATDITTRRRAEAAIRESEERFRTVVETAPEAIFIRKQERFTYLNDAALRMFGAERREQLIGQSVLDRFHPEYRERIRGRIRQLDESGESTTDIEQIFLRLDGSPIDVIVSAAPFVYRNEKSALVFVRDITVRKEREREIERLTRLYATLSQVNQTIVRATSREELFKSVCRVVIEFGKFRYAWLGWQEVGGAALRCMALDCECADPCDLPPGIMAGCGISEEALRTGQAAFSNQTQHDQRTSVCHAFAQDLKLGSCAAIPFRFQGNVRGILGICSPDEDFFNTEEIRLLDEIAMDISYALDRLHEHEQRHLAEEAVRIAEEKYHSIFENAIDGIYQSTPDGTVLSANPALARMYGFASSQELIESVKDAGQQLHVEPARREEFKRLLEERGSVANFEVQVRRKDGRLIWIATTARAVRDVTGHVAFYEGLVQDITARKQAENALHEREEQLRLFVQHSPAAIAMLDHEMRYLIVSNRWLSDYRLENRDIIGHSHYEIFPEIPQRWKDIHQRCLAGAIEKCEEDPFPRADGRNAWLRWEIRPWERADGSVGGIIIFSEDITARKEADERIESLSRFPSENPSPVLRFSPNGTVLYANEASLPLLQLWNCQVGQRLPEDRAGNIVQALESETVSEMEITAAGRIYLIKFTPLPASGYVNAYGQDITERKQGEQRIWHLNRVYAVLSDINQTIVREKNKDTMLAAACRIAVEKGGFRMAWVGLMDGQFGQLKVQAHAGADGDTVELLKSIADGGGCEFTRYAYQMGSHSICNDVENESKGMNWRDAALQRDYQALGAFPLKDGEKVIGVFNIYAGEKFFFDEEELRLLDELAMDISFALVIHERELLRLKTEQELHQIEERLRQSQKMEAIGQLAGGVAHDFNNILAAIMMQTELAAMEKHIPSGVRDGLREIHASAERAANLTRQLLLFSRRQIMQSRDLNLNESVTNLAKMLQRIIGEDISLQLNLSPVPVITHADAGMVDQVLMNLAVNARDAMPNGGKLIIATAQVVIDETLARKHSDAVPGQYVCLQVNDSGTGIPPEVLPRIFEPFFTTKEPGKGTGLGLSTVFGIVKQHHGWVKVSSEPDCGTEFQIFLPDIGASAIQRTAERIQNKPHGGTETILLAEDDAAVRLITRSTLARFGYTILEASNGAEAVQIVNQYTGTIHLLLTDIVMPGGMSGRELAARLREKNPQLRVLFTSGYSAEIAGRELSLQPGQNFIQKPCLPFQLLETVRRCLDG